MASPGLLIRLILVLFILSGCAPAQPALPTLAQPEPAKSTTIPSLTLTLPPTTTIPPTEAIPPPSSIPTEEPLARPLVTTPPVLVNQVGGVSRAIAYQDGYAYLGTGLRILVLDVSDPATPQVVGQTEILPGIIHTITVIEKRAYVTGWEIGGLFIFDISNPAQPRRIGFCPLGGLLRKVVVQGDLAFVLHLNGAYIVDIADPANPIELARYGNPYLQHVDLAVAENFVYLATDIGDVYYFEIIKNAFSDPPRAFEAHGRTEALAVQGKQLFILNQDNLQVVDIGNPAVGLKEIDRLEFTFEDSNALELIAISENMVLLAGEFLQIVDVTNPRLMKVIGRLGAYGESLAVGNNHAYLARFSGGMTTVDLVDPATPVQLAEYKSGYETPGSIAVLDHWLLVSDWNGVYSLDVTDPLHPVVAGFYRKPDVEPWIQSIVVSQDLAYLAYPNVGLSILDLADPSSLTEIGSLPGAAWDLVIDDELAYVIEWGTLYAADISNPSAPRRLGVCDLPHTNEYGANSIALMGAYAYVPAGEAGLHVIDITNPEAPHLVKTIESGYYSGIMILDELIYTSDSTGGVLVLDTDTPTDPHQVTYIEPSEETLKIVDGRIFEGQMVKVSGQYVYALVQDLGLLVYRLGP